MLVAETNEPKRPKLRQTKILTTIEEGYNTDRHGPCVEEDECLRPCCGSEDRAKILENIVTIRRNNVFWIAYM
jgi:hypothetical protein